MSIVILKIWDQTNLSKLLYLKQDVANIILFFSNTNSKVQLGEEESTGLHKYCKYKPNP